jgi:hypothetical protein
MLKIGLSIPAIMASEDGSIFVRAGVLRSPFVITRAQTGGVESSAINGGNDGLTFYGPDVPRFTGPSQRLLLESQGTNHIRNPRGEGAVAGTPGTMPTNWVAFGNGAGLTWNVVGSGIENNLPYVDLRLSGTSSSTVGPLIRVDPVYPTASIGQSWTYSNYIRVAAGSLAGISDVRQFITEWTIGGVFLSQQFSSVSVSAAFGRQAVTFTLAQATVGQAGSQIGFAPQIGVPIDCTFRIAAPQLEQNAFASSQIFPPVGTPGVSTRGGDFVNASLSSLGIAGNGACTLLWSGVLPVLAPSGASALLPYIDDGTDANRYFLIVFSSGGSLFLARDVGGTGVSSLMGTVSAGASFKCGMTINSAGRVAASLNGAAPVVLTGGVTSGLSTLRIGSTAFAATLNPQEVLRFCARPGGVSDAQLQSLVNAL